GGDSEASLPRFKVNGEEVSFNVTTTVVGGPMVHRFRGWVKGDTIEGNVTVSGDAMGQRAIRWSAKQTARRQIRMGSDGVARAGAREGPPGRARGSSASDAQRHLNLWAARRP